MVKKINIGCGHDKLSGYINVDWNQECNPDIIYNINNGLPFDCDSIDEVLANDILEHCDDFVSIMNEIHRVLKIGGKLRARFPPWNSEGAFSVAHARRIIYRDFRSFVEGDSRDFVYSVNGEKLKKGFKMIASETVVGKCLYCPEGSHKKHKCHIIMEKIK